MATFAPAAKPAKPVDPLAGTGGIKPAGTSMEFGGSLPNVNTYVAGVDNFAGTPLAGTGGIKAPPPPPSAAPAPVAAAPQATANPINTVFQEALVNQLSGPPDPFASTGGGVQLANGDWVPNDHPLAAQAAPAATAAPVTAPTTAPVTVPTTAVGPVRQPPEEGPSSPSGIDEEYRKAILAQLTAGQEPIDVENDPRAAAYRVAQKRNADRTRAQATESAAQNGMLGTGGFNGVNRAIDASRAESEAGYEAGLVGEQMDERRQELQFAMTMAGQMGDRESEEAIRRELAQLDAQVQREGLDVTKRGQDLDAMLQKMGFGVTTRGQDVQKYGIDKSAEIDMADQLLRRYGLDLNDKQTRQRLGFDYAALTEQANRQAVLAALGLGE